MQEPYDVAVVGGGMAGAILAWALRREGLTVCLLERGAPPGSDPAPGDPERVSALGAGSRGILEGLGLWDRIEGFGPEPVTAIEVTDGPGGGGAPLTAAEAGVPALGQVTPNRALVAAAWECLREDGEAGLFPSSTVTGVEWGRHCVRLKVDHAGTERILTTRLVVGADGEHSRIREAAGIGTWGWHHNRYALVATVAAERPLRGRAFERFLPEGPLAFLPLGGRAASIVWTLPPSEAVDLQELEEGSFLARLRERLGPVLGRLEAVGGRALNPLELRLARRFTGARLALVGNAGHLLHPVAAQGFNLGLRDVATLAGEAGKARRRGWDPGSPAVLERYAQHRRGDTARVVAFTEGLNRLFANDLEPLGVLRRLGLRALHRSGPLKRALMEQAMGRVPGQGEARPLWEKVQP